jgi:hypothetical protein
MGAGETPLHAALRRRASSAALAAIVEFAAAGAARDAVVNAKSVAGLTPLMLACMAQPSDTGVGAARYLLAHGAERTLGAHSQKRRSAADYAREHGKPLLALELDERLTRLQQNAAIAGPPTDSGAACVTWQQPGEKGLRCVMCGDRLGPSKFGRADRLNSLIDGLLSGAAFGLDSSAASDVLRALSVPALHHVNNGRRFTRELTESLAMLRAARRVFADGVQAGGAGAGGVGTGWHLIDLCAGKGYTAAIAAALNPALRVTAIDRMEERFVPHFAEAGLANVAYARLDVLAENFVHEVAALIGASGVPPSRTLVLGMHLCGLLSLAAVDLVRSLRLPALILAPCCLPHRERALHTPLDVHAARGQNAQYTRWCDFLEAEVRDACAAAGDAECAACGCEVPHSLLREEVPQIVSVKRTLITGVRAQPARAGSTSPE